MQANNLKIGLFGIGLEAYWQQFDGLKERLTGYLSIAEQNLSAIHPKIINAGLVDNVDKAFEAGSLFRREEADLIILYVGTYALSSTVLPVVQKAKVPVLILNLSPDASIDYKAFNQMTDRTKMTGEWLAYCSACPVPEIANVFNRTGIKFHQITGMLNNDPECWNEITDWVEAAKVASIMANNRLGCMGHYYSGMLDIYTDLTQQYAHFGGHIELLEVDELAAMRKEITNQEIEERVQLFQQTFEVQEDCDLAELQRAAKTSVALEKLVAKYQLGSMAYFYKGSGNDDNEDTISSIILGNSLLTANGVPVAGEYEIKNAQAMKIMDSFGAGGSFTEYYAMDFKEDVVLMGHDGPGHIAIAEGKTKVRPLKVYHGKVGKGLSVEMSVKKGPVTLLSVVDGPDGKLKLLVAEGESVEGPILEIGNTNSRYKFSIGARKFVNNWNSHGPAHHCAVGVGHISSKIEKLGALLNMGGNKSLLSMKKLNLLIIVLFAYTSAFSQRVSKDFNADWKFFLGNDSTLRYSIKDSSKLEKVQLPHDWSILGDFSEKHPTTSQQGALPAGMGWYVKTFDVPTSEKGKQIYIEFDGIYRNATVYLNGKKIGFWPYGYTSYRYDLTSNIKYGQQNYIAVKVDNSEQPSSRWYTGSGIYRNVRLVTTNPIAVAHWGTLVSTPKVNEKSATIKLEVTLRNDNPVAEKAKIVSEIVDASGKKVTQTVNYLHLDDSLKTANQAFRIKNPHLWSPTQPYLYQVKTKVYVNNKQVDGYTTPLGIRTFHFDANKGFFFNGKAMKILGVCMHHDLGAIGAVVNESAIRRQLKLLKEMGTNAIRVSHNPPSPEFLTLCDEMGFLVMDEAFDMWQKKKNKFDYHQEFDEWHERDLKAMVMRDRNHPSVFMWSVGNEIREQFDATGTSFIKELVDIVKKYDPTREVTTAMTEMEPDKNFITKANAIDVLGFNYKHKLYPTLPKSFPGKSFLATETASALATRGVYIQPQDTVQLWPANSKNKYMENLNGDWTVSAYDNVSAYWGTSHEESWLAVKNKPYMAGIFVWSGFDYLGEPHPFNYPARSSYYGVIDLAGFPKDVYYMYQSEWSDKPVLHLLPHWNWKEGQKVEVWAYYNQADEVELFVNGVSQGIRKKSENEAHVSWSVIYKAGNIKAVSRKNGKVVLTEEIKTAKAPKQITLSADTKSIKADGKEISFITVSAVDEDGVPVPDAMNNISFELDGDAEIAGVDNGYQANLQSFQAHHINLYNGKALVMIKGNQAGKVILKASSPGLSDASISLDLTK